MDYTYKDTCPQFCLKILVLSYAESFYIGQTEFQRFWEYGYQLYDVPAVLEELLDCGYIEPGKIESTLHHMRVSDLKSELRLRGLSQSGKKDALISRLLNCEDIDNIASKYPQYYALTELGKYELKANEYVRYLHNHTDTIDISMREMKELLDNDTRGFSYRDYIWGYFNEIAGPMFASRNFAQYAQNRINMYVFALEENRPILNLLSEAIYYEISGAIYVGSCLCVNDEELLRFQIESYTEYIAPHNQPMYELPPRTIGLLDDYKNRFNLSYDELKEKLKSDMSNMYCRFAQLTNDECLELTMAELKNDDSAIEAIYLNVW